MFLGDLQIMDPEPVSPSSLRSRYFIHAGSTYLYVEQQQGARLTVFDVTDPSRIKTVSSTLLAVERPFNSFRPLDGRAKLTGFRDGKGVAVLDPRKASKPTVRMVSALINPGQMEPLGEAASLP